MKQSNRKEFEAGKLKIIQVGGVFGGECFLLISPETSFLADSGFAFSSEKMTERVKKELGDRDLDYILLTHSHFDHAGGSAAAADAYPNVKIAAHERAAKVFEKESARKVMKDMDAIAAMQNEMSPKPEYFDRIRANLPVTFGTILRTADEEVHVLEGTGHTWDAIGFWFPEEGLLVSNESACILIDGCGDTPIPEFIVSYHGALATIDRFAALNPRHLLVPHFGVVSGDAAGKFLAAARRACEEVADLVLSQYELGLDTEEIAREISRRYHTNEHKEFQSDEAYIVNMRAMIPRLIDEFTQR